MLTDVNALLDADRIAAALRASCAPGRIGAPAIDCQAQNERRPPGYHPGRPSIDSFDRVNGRVHAAPKAEGGPRAINPTFD